MSRKRITLDEIFYLWPNKQQALQRQTESERNMPLAFCYSNLNEHIFSHKTFIFSKFCISFLYIPLTNWQTKFLKIDVLLLFQNLVLQGFPKTGIYFCKLELKFPTQQKPMGKKKNKKESDNKNVALEIIVFITAILNLIEVIVDLIKDLL